MEENSIGRFSSKIGVVLAAAGGAIGLGNIWKFPYVAGESGGGAFLIVYLICVLLFGVPLVMTEFIIGRKARKSAYGAFNAISGNRRWQWLGWWCIVSAYLIMGFYFVVTGWCCNYLYEAITNAFAGLDADGLSKHFVTITSSTPRVIICCVVPIILTSAVLWFGVQKGIERLSKILLPLLFVMMILMVIRVLMIDGSGKGLRFFFQTDFSLITPKVVMVALGQCFFSLSVGIGALITYGAYMPGEQNITSSSLQVAILDILVAVLAGVIIFPAVFAFGFDPQEGPQLVFVVLPAIFQQMSFAWLSGVLFFILLLIAALTSTISLMEVAVASLCDASGNKLNRHQSVLLATGIVLVMVVLCVLSMTEKWEWLTIAGRNLFDCFDDLVTTIMMPIGALCMSLFVGWFMPSRNIDLVPYSQKSWKAKLRPVLIFALRWIVPVTILLILLNGLGLLDALIGLFKH